MSRTYRNVPVNKWHRTPRYKGKLVDGASRKRVVTEYDDKPVAGLKENRHRLAWMQ